MFKNILFLFFFLFCICACDEKEIEKDELKCVVSGKISPFSFYEDYNLTGFEIDLMNLIGKTLNKKIIFENIVGSQTTLLLERGYADLAISTFVITKDRQKDFFMIPYHSEKLALLFNKKNHQFSDIDHFNSQNSKEISSLYGMYNKEFVEWSKKKIPSAKITYFFNEVLTLYALNNNLVSAVIMTQSEANSLKNSMGALYDYIPMDDFVFSFGILIPRGNKKLQAKISGAISELQENGEIQNLARKYNIFYPG